MGGKDLQTKPRGLRVSKQSTPFWDGGPSPQDLSTLEGPFWPELLQHARPVERGTLPDLQMGWRAGEAGSELGPSA